MLLTLITALSTIAVPFVPQTDALCGGAAAAMVFRYWGDQHADAAQFGVLVKRRLNGATGIQIDALTTSIQSRGWRTESADRSLTALEARLTIGQPVIVLLASRGRQYHYVVVIGMSVESVIVHDPSWGPSRAIPVADFSRLWARSQNWSLVVLPPEPGSSPAPLRAEGSVPAMPGEGSVPATLASDPCADLLDAAVAAIHARGLEYADEILQPVRTQCPGSAGPLRELAGVRFGQRRWRDAATLARDALDVEPGDQYALLVLGASLFLQDDPVAALRVWNTIGQPKLDLVRIEGLHRSRYQTIVETLGLRPNTLLTAEAFLLAKRRLDELPDRSSARLTVRPEDNGFASVDVVIAERSDAPRGFAEWAGAAAGAGVDREIAATVPGLSGQGELWSASWRWWSNRPRLEVGFAAPRVGGSFGVWRVEGSWATETYETGGATLQRESRAHGGLTVSDWLTGNIHYSLSAGFDAWDAGQRAASFGTSLDRRWLGDRVSVAANATTWLPVDRVANASGFSALGARAVVGSTAAASVWVYRASVGAERVSDDAPLTLWPGAGEGQARPVLLRAHPLLDDGVIDVRAGSVFGRSIQYASAELQRWLDHPGFVRLGIATFIDVAQATRQTTFGTSVTQADPGAGLRLRLPGSGRVLRIDVAHGLRDGANALTVGWVY